ncbi:hypothetical protein [Leptolyngbya sp. ST-U4]|uniref:hypothetical protein n=1 Tax=Leptolyngbya sp. ST-U4 TaxID=2933912 RepID=UPI00329696F0
MTLQLKKPFSRLAPLIHLVRSVLQIVRQTIQARSQRTLTAASIPLDRSISASPPIEVPAVPVPIEAEPFPEVIAVLPTPELQQPLDRPTEGSSAERPTEGGSAERPTEGGSAERSRQVVELLEEADRLGLITYPQLMDYVKAKTGTACSRRTIANWKRARQPSE